MLVKPSQFIIFPNQQCDMVTKDETNMDNSYKISILNNFFFPDDD